MRKSTLVLFTWIVASAALVAADPPTISAAVPWGDCEGYTPVVITISSGLERTVRLRATAGPSTALADVTVSGGQAVRTTLLLPPLDDGSPSVNIRWTSDDGMAGEFPVSAANADRSLGLAVIDSDERIPLKSLDFVTKIPWTTMSMYGGRSGNPEVKRVPLADLPERWQGYPTWTTLVIAATDDQAMSPEQRRAIATWVGTGGAVVVAEAAQREPWRALGVEPLLLNKNEDAITSRISEIGGNVDQPKLTPVPGTESVPATGFMLLATCFALVVGPLNLWWVRKRGIPGLFLLTTPILSLGTCVVLLGANVLIEGLSLRRIASQLTILDQRQAHAVTWTRATYYAGFSVARFDADPESKVRCYGTEQDMNSGYGYRRGYRRETPESRTIDWRGGQHLTGEWIPARRNRQLLYCFARPERAQVQITRAGNAWRITNGLGVAILRLSWRDGSGRIHGCGAVPAGESAELTGGNEEVAIPAQEFSRPAAYSAAMQPWSFAAELAGPFGALPGPTGIDAKPVTSYMVGRLNPGAAP